MCNSPLASNKPANIKIHIIEKKITLQKGNWDSFGILLGEKIPHNFCLLQCIILHCMCGQSYPTLWDPMDCSPSGLLLCPWDFPGKNTGLRCHFLLQEIFLTQGWNLGLLHWQMDSLHWATWEAQCIFCVLLIWLCLIFMWIWITVKPQKNSNQSYVHMHCWNQPITWKIHVFKSILVLVIWEENITFNFLNFLF